MTYRPAILGGLLIFSALLLLGFLFIPSLVLGLYTGGATLWTLLGAVFLIIVCGVLIGVRRSTRNR
jgi:hypothetical protein